MDRAVYWFDHPHTPTNTPAPTHPPLDRDIEPENLVIGGGMAGVACAERLLELGQGVALIDAAVCGSGATGRSSGFITPNAELDLQQLVRRFGASTAARLWSAAVAACDHIRDAIQRDAIDCDFIAADSLYAATSRSGAREIEEEHRTHQHFGFPSEFYSDTAAVRAVLRTNRYPAAVRFPRTCGINAGAYVRARRDALAARGVRVFELTPALSIDDDGGGVRTPGGRIRARRIFLCTDRFTPRLGGIARRQIHPARTYLALTAPLPPTLLHDLFPDGPLMVWDTDLVYQYFRPTAEGRLLIGGSLLSRVYAARDGDPGPVIARLRDYIGGVHPALREVEFTHFWPGLIGTTKDILPLAGPLPQRRRTFIAAAGAGLPWSVLAGRTAAERAVLGAGEFDRVFDPARPFTTIDPVQPLLGKMATWGLAYYVARNLERGDARAVKRRQSALRIGLGAMGLAAAAAVAVGLRTRGRLTAPAPRPRLSRT